MKEIGQQIVKPENRQNFFRVGNVLGLNYCVYFALSMIMFSNICFAFVNVKDYGAVGDGIANDTSAIESADVEAKNTNTDVYFPSGNYKLKDASMTARRWYGNGDSSVIKADITSTCAAVEIKQQTDCTIDHLLFNSTATDETTGIFGINAENSSYITIRNVRFATGLNNGVRMMTCDELLLTENIVENMIGIGSGHGYGFLFHTGCTNGTVSNNEFYSSPGKGRHGVYIASGSSYFDVIDNYCEGFNYGAIQLNTYPNQPYTHHINIENNTCMNDINPDNPYAGAITISGKDSDILIKNNTIDGARVGITVNGAPDQIPRNIDIIGNTVRNVRTGLIALRACEDVMVKGNILSAGGLSEPLVHSAILVANYDTVKYKNIEIYRNYLFDAPDLKRFILANGNNDGGSLKITNNKVEALYGVDVSGGTVNQSIYIYNNTFSLTERDGIPPTGLLVRSDATITSGNRIQFRNNIVAFTSPTYAKYVYYCPSQMYGQFYVDTNCYYNTTSSMPFQYKGVNKSWSEWNALSFDTNSYGPSTNPELDEKLDLLSNSVCIDSGTYLSGGDSYWDYYGILRSNYDIGCYEYVAP